MTMFSHATVQTCNVVMQDQKIVGETVQLPHLLLQR